MLTRVLAGTTALVAMAGCASSSDPEQVVEVTSDTPSATSSPSPPPASGPPVSPEGDVSASDLRAAIRALTAADTGFFRSEVAFPGVEISRVGTFRISDRSAMGNESLTVEGSPTLRSSWMFQDGVYYLALEGNDTGGDTCWLTFPREDTTAIAELEEPIDVKTGLPIELRVILGASIDGQATADVLTAASLFGAPVSDQLGLRRGVAARTPMDLRVSRDTVLWTIDVPTMVAAAEETGTDVRGEPGDYAGGTIDVEVSGPGIPFDGYVPPRASREMIDGTHGAAALRASLRAAGTRACGTDSLVITAPPCMMTP